MKESSIKMEIREIFESLATEVHQGMHPYVAVEYWYTKYQLQSPGPSRLRVADNPPSASDYAEFGYSASAQQALLAFSDLCKRSSYASVARAFSKFEKREFTGGQMKMWSEPVQKRHRSTLARIKDFVAKVATGVYDDILQPSKRNAA